MTTYFPSREEVRRVALSAKLRNPNPDARGWVIGKVEQPPDDWDERSFLTVPGIVWTVSSDTCATGRLSAPENVAYDHYSREFVFRQPRNDQELAAVMSADCDEVFSCYRFDGLYRWTSRSVGAWMEDMHVVLGYVQRVLATSAQANLPEGIQNYEAYLTSTDFHEYLGELRRELARRH